MMVKDDKLLKIFVALRKKIKTYEKKKLKVITDEENRYELSGNKDYHVTSLRTGNKIKKKDAYFVGIIIQKSYVGFYFMPPYSEQGFMDSFSELLNKQLKGKSCFYFKKIEEVSPEIDDLLKKGYQLYKEKGLV